MNMQTSKPSKLAVSLKTRKDNTYKRSMNDDDAFENGGGWPMLLSKDGSMTDDNNKVSKTLADESSLSSSLLSPYSFKADEEPCCDMISNSSIFRRMTDNDDQEDMMELKRANPVYDSDDTDDCIGIRTTGKTTVLQWGERLEEHKTKGFCLMNLLQD